MKRDSKRRWKARCKIGRPIPLQAIVEHRLNTWFAFEPRDPYSEFYFACTRAVGGKVNNGALSP